jgi:hypothetical protein
VIVVTVGSLLIAALSIVAVIQERRTNDTREAEWANERGLLLQRIQAPERAVAQYDHENHERDLVFNVPFDDDEAFQAVAAKRRISE